MVGTPQRQIVPPSQSQPPHQHQPPMSYQAQTQTQLSTFPPPQQQQQPQQSSSQTGPAVPVKRRPLPSPGAPRTFPSINTASSTIAPSPSTISNVSPVRGNFTQPQLSSTTSQPASPVKSSPTRAPSSPTKAHRPLPTPGGGGGGSGGISGAGGNSWAREGFAGIGTKSNSSRVTGLPIDPSVSSLVAGIKPDSLYILPLPDGSSPEKEGVDTPTTTSPIRTGLPNPPSLIQPGSSTDGSINKRRAASPPRFQPGSSADGHGGNATTPTSTPNSPTKGPSPSASSAGHKLSPSASSITGQSSSRPGSSGQHAQSTSSENSPTKKYAPTWKRTIPEYPQPAFGYAAGMVKDPWTKSPTLTATKATTNTSPASSSSGSKKQKHVRVCQLLVFHLSTLLMYLI